MMRQAPTERPSALPAQYPLRSAAPRPKIGVCYLPYLGV